MLRSTQAKVSFFSRPKRNIFFNSFIQTITAFFEVIMITDAFSHNTDTLQ